MHDTLNARFPHLAALPAGCYVVGGAVRDLLAGVDPADADLACADPLRCAEALGHKVIRLGKEQLSAWRVVIGEHVYDFAEIVGDGIVDDLGRRDFTINAMALPVGGGALLDPHGGEDDLRARIVRMVDSENFDDDPLRMLKGVRMAVKLGFTIDPHTLEAIRVRSRRIVESAPERITSELSAILSAHAFRRAAALLRETRLDVPLLGRELDPSAFHADDVSLAGAYALLVADPRLYAERWRWSEHLQRSVTALQRLLRAEGDLRVALYDAGEEVARQFPPLLRALGRADAVTPLLTAELFATEALLSGEEIAALAGVAPGPELGRLKRGLVVAQLEGRVQGREEAERFIRGGVGGL
jgi:tRNA nucleotidyltransferase/poly(A) polymerase